MNSDFTRLTSLRCVTSSSSVTTPTSRSSASFIGVERIRNARRAPSTAQGSVAAASSDAAGACDRSTSATDCTMRESRVTASIGFPSASALAPNRRSAAGLTLVTSPPPSATMTGSNSESITASVVCCATSNLPMSDRRSSRSRSAIRLKLTASAPISSADLTGTGGVSRSPDASRAVAAVSCATGPTIAFERLTSMATPAAISTTASASVTKNQRLAMREAASALRRIASWFRRNKRSDAARTVLNCGSSD